MACHETAETRPQNPTAHDLYDQTIYLDELIRQQTEQDKNGGDGNFDAALYVNIDGNVVTYKHTATCIDYRGDIMRLSLLNLNGHAFLQKSVESIPIARKRSGSATGVLIKIASSGEIQGWLDEQRGSDCRLRFDEDCPQLNEEEAQAAAEAILADLNDVVNREAQEEEPRTSLERVLGSKVLGIVQPTLAVRS